HVGFATPGLEDGIELSAYFARKYPGRDLRILDVGAGNGGVRLALANLERNRVTAADVVYNPELARLRARSGLPVEQAMATADRPAFSDATFDAVLCPESIEHLPHAAAAGP